MKKFLALVLSVVMVASLAACGNSGTKETQAPAASGDSATATESTAAEQQVRQQRRLETVLMLRI